MYSIIFLALTCLVLVQPDAIFSFLSVDHDEPDNEFDLVQTDTKTLNNQNFATNANTKATSAESPLILTPYLKNGRISMARKLSAVDGIGPGYLSSNAGFFTVDAEYDSNLFFWFYRQTSSKWKDAPLILWLQGGPGCSSLYGLFCENGPLRVVRNGTNFHHLSIRKFAWTKEYNMIYLDQPVGSGFSFTKNDSGYVTNEEQIGEHLLDAILQFYQLYPELKKNAFFIAGESYAGKYIPTAGRVIHRHNANPSNSATSINLKGLVIGNGLVELESMNKLSDYAHRLGLIDHNTRKLMSELEESMKMHIRAGNYTIATNEFNRNLQILKNAAHVSLYDYTKSGSNAIDTSYIDLFKRDEFRKKIHVSKQSFNHCSAIVYNNLRTDISQSVKPVVEELLEHYRMLFYNGQLDVVIGYPLSENMYRHLLWSGAHEYRESVRKIWKMRNRVVGYHKSGGNFTEVLIRRAGHCVPADRPFVALEMLKKFVTKQWE